MYSDYGICLDSRRICAVVGNTWGMQAPAARAPTCDAVAHWCGDAPTSAAGPSISAVAGRFISTPPTPGAFTQPLLPNLRDATSESGLRAALRVLHPDLVTRRSSAQGRHRDASTKRVVEKATAREGKRTLVDPRTLPWPVPIERSGAADSTAIRSARLPV